MTKEVKIKNPFKESPNYQCFGCSPNNEKGLQLEFVETEDELISRWQPKNYMQGYDHVLHGGIQSTLMDEIASWTVYIKAKTAGVTARMNVSYHKPVYTNKGVITIHSKLVSIQKRFADIHTWIEDAEGNKCSEAEIRYFIYPENIARAKLNYPGIEAFYD